MITDTHTHLYSSKFDEDRDEVIKRAKEAGVTRFFIPAIDSSYNERMLDLQEKYPKDVFLMMGLHPTSVGENYKEELAMAKELLDTKKFYAVGEIGMDLYWDKTFIKEQQDAFATQIRWAKEMKLPINIHCRDAFNEVFEILESEKSDDLKGIFHCFTGSHDQAKKAISYNMKLGIGGVVTFKNAKFAKFLNDIDIKNIVLETDAPYLAPTPYRGKRNESGYLTEVVTKLAEVYSLTYNDIAKITTENSKEIFGI